MIEQLQFELTYFTPENAVGSTDTAGEGWSSANGVFENKTLGICFTVKEENSARGTRLQILREDIVESLGNRIKELTVLLPGAAGHENDGGTLVLPLETGMLCKNMGKLSKEYRIPVFGEREWDIFWCNMGLYGQLNDNGSTGIVLEGGKFDCELRLRTAFGPEKEYRIDPVYLVREWVKDDIQMQDISLFIIKTDSGKLADLANAFRSYNQLERKLPSLLDKCVGNPDLAYSMKALTVRCRLAVKELPCKVLEQTPETEPPIRVYMNCKEVENIARSYRENGIGPAEFCLVGWNYGGHDGAFPQLFPVCSAVGTGDDIRHAADVVNECGYKLNLHDNYYDAYTLAENFDFGDVCTDDVPPHMPVHGGGLLGGGRAYRICGKQAIKYEEENLKMVKERFPQLSGAYFIDVASLICNHRCADPRHPETRTENAMSNKTLLRNLQKQYGVSMSEGGRDWSLPELDRAYMLANKSGNEKVYDYTDEAVPLYQMVYHGYVIYNILRSGINCWPGTSDYLINITTGGIPMVYYHHLFNPDWGAYNGCKIDLDTTPEAIEADAPLIKQVSDDIARVADLAGVFITDYIRHPGNITETCFENGASIFANYGETPAEINGMTIAPMSFTVVK